MEPRINFITLGVKNFKRSVAFYRDGLKFPFSSSSQGDIAFFSLNCLVLALYPKKLLAKDGNLKIIGKGFGGITVSHNVKNPEDVDRTLSEVKKIGGKILKQAEDTFWGGRSGYFADPDGYPWEIAWNPHVKMDRDGRIVLSK
jgi:catechol 2,3-dioxygenase-like lactoylglutathione lyase family enzyme